MKDQAASLGLAGVGSAPTTGRSYAQFFEWRVAGIALCVFVGYYLGAKVGFALTFRPHPVSVLWPPNAILLAALLLTPVRIWWVVLLAAFPAHLATQVQSNVPPAMIFCWFVSNSCEALIGAGCIRYFTSRPIRFDRLSNVAVFCLGGVFLAPFLSSFLDSAFVALNHWGHGSYWEIWRIRFTSNVLAALTIAAPIVTWATEGIIPRQRISPRRVLEGGCLLAGLLGISFVVFNKMAKGGDDALLYAPSPFLLWAAVRFRSRGATASVSAVAFLAIWGVAHGHGPFSEESAEVNAFSVQLFLIFMSVPLLFLAAIIEERDKVVEALREREERIGLAAESANLALWTIDFLGHESWMSDKGREFFGFAPNERLSRELFLSRVHPDDRTTVDAAIERARADSQTFEVEYRLLRPDGETRWLIARGHYLKNDRGEISELLGIAVDVTERKQTEQLFQLAAEASHLGVWHWDETTGKLLSDSATREIFDVPGEGEVTLDTFYGAIYPHDLERVKQVWRGAIESGQPYELEYRVQRSNGAIGWVHARGRGYYDDKGKPIRMIGIVIDVTAQTNANIELRRQGEDMARLNRVAAMGELTASLAHELNQPLTAIASNAAAGKRFLASGAANPKMFEELLTDVFADARRAGAVIHGIHHFVRKGEGTRQAVDLNEIVREVLRLLHSDFLGRAVAVETQFASTLAKVNGDPIQLQQVLLNLIMNALEAMHSIPTEKRRILISTESDDNASALVSVRDYGRGLPQEDPNKVFAQFYSTKPNGMGMGLTIVRSIIEAHGGKLRAENVDQGARFSFALPVTRKSEAREVA